MTVNLTQLLEKAATLPEVIQEEIALQWLDDIENELQWQATLEQPQPKLEQLALAALQQKGFNKCI
jgi:hypothetical protein